MVGMSGQRPCFCCIVVMSSSQRSRVACVAVMMAVEWQGMQLIWTCSRPGPGLRDWMALVFCGSAAGSGSRKRLRRRTQRFGKDKDGARQSRDAGKSATLWTAAASEARRRFPVPRSGSPVAATLRSASREAKTPSPLRSAGAVQDAGAFFHPHLQAGIFIRP
jgi:hypothetical protein